MHKKNNHHYIKIIIYCFLVLFVLADLGYSFIQHYNTTLDGDMAGGIVPSNDVQKILDNPLALKVLTEKASYPNPNRFFSHWAFYKYFNTVPLFLQNFTDPINSIYLSCAIIKTLIQLGLIIILSFFISGSKNIFKSDFLISAFLITPLFQTYGYNTYMGIIDNSITYTFFYALPSLILLIYLYPLFKVYFYNETILKHWTIWLVWTFLAFVICLSGPLNPGIILIISFLILISLFIKNYNLEFKDTFIKKVFKSVHSYYLYYFVPISLIALYSLYIGSFNSINKEYQLPLIQLYQKIPEGIFYQFTQKLGFPILFIAIVTNIIISKSLRFSESKKNFQLYKWIVVFIIMYIILLPLGGYRPYRSNILRYDTIIPITISILFIFGHSTLFNFRNLNKKSKIFYSLFILTILFIFTNADEMDLKKTECERIGLTKISDSTENIVKIENDCTVLTWNKIEDPESTQLNADLLKKWNIIKEKKLYYNATLIKE